MAVVHVENNQNFAQLISGDKLVLVDFWAPWCGPCKMIAPILDELSEQSDVEVSIVKVNVDEHPELASEHGVMSIPTLKWFKNGEAVHQNVGVTPLAALVGIAKRFA